MGPLGEGGGGARGTGSWAGGVKRGGGGLEVAKEGISKEGEVVVGVEGGLKGGGGGEIGERVNKWGGGGGCLSRKW